MKPISGVKSCIYIIRKKGVVCIAEKELIWDDLFNDNLYDIDHIYPRHFVKDDSIDNNLVLVKKEINAHKSDGYPLADGIQKKCRVFWNELKSGGFITAEKYEKINKNIRIYGR